MFAAMSGLTLRSDSILSAAQENTGKDTTRGFEIINRQKD
jgi:hypothetical protein